MFRDMGNTLYDKGTTPFVQEVPRALEGVYRYVS